MALDQSTVLRQIDSLLAIIRPGIDRTDMFGEYWKGNAEDTRALRTRAVAMIERLAPRRSAYREQASQVEEEHVGADGHAIVGLAGVLMAIRADVESGYLATVEELVHADVFADFLDMATELLSKSYKDPAAVLTGSVLEQHLRALAAKAGVATTTPDGGHKKADTLNADLVKANVLTKLEQKEITALLGLRNEAAHGNYASYAKDRVEAMVRDVRSLMIRHPA